MPREGWCAHDGRCEEAVRPLRQEAQGKRSGGELEQRVVRVPAVLGRVRWILGLACRGSREDAVSGERRRHIIGRKWRDHHIVYAICSRCGARRMMEPFKGDWETQYVGAPFLPQPYCPGEPAR